MEQQRAQLEEQERQVAQLRGRIALLEGGVNPSIGGPNGNTIDDFSIKVRSPPVLQWLTLPGELIIVSVLVYAELCISAR